MVLQQVKYPAAKRQPLTDQLFKRQVADPYRWLEDPKASDTIQFVNRQNELSKSILDQFSGRDKLKKFLTDAYDYERFGCPFRQVSSAASSAATPAPLYFFHNSGLQAQSVLYRYAGYAEGGKLPSIDKCEVFFDPNKLSDDGTASLATYEFTETGSLFAYGVSYAGSDWTTVKVMRSKDKSDLTDLIKWVKFSGLTWTQDERGFFYQSYPKPEVDDAGTETDINTCPSLYYHQLGDQQSDDFLIYNDPSNPTHMFSTTVTDDGKYLVMSTSNSCDPVNKLFISDLTQTTAAATSADKSKWKQFTKIVDDFSALYSYVANVGTEFYFRTNNKAPKYKIVKYDLSKPAAGFQDFIPEHSTNVLENACLFAHDKLFLNYMKDCKNVASVYSLATGKKIKDLDHDIGAIDSVSCRQKDDVLFFRMSSFLNPGVVYRYDAKQDDLDQFYVTRLKLDGFKFDDYVQSQVFYTSKDGKTKIPMFLVQSKATAADKNTPKPVYLYGYGGFNISLTPMFSPQWLVFMKCFGGTLAVANIRGGGEYGDEWHKAGCLLNKQNGFDDFQYAAKYLVSSGLTKPELIAINGGSNGGLLVAACTNQAPELIGCAIAEVGVLDMLRFHKFTIGHAWRSDYGDPDKEEDFEYILKYSPLHNVAKDEVYPWTMLLTSDHDDRVVPLHSYKYIAELQHHRSENPNPLIIRVDVKAGHGKGKPTSKRIDEAVERLSFIALSMKLTI